MRDENTVPPARDRRARGTGRGENLSYDSACKARLINWLKPWLMIGCEVGPIPAKEGMR